MVKLIISTATIYIATIVKSPNYRSRNVAATTEWTYVRSSVRVLDNIVITFAYASY